MLAGGAGMAPGAALGANVGAGIAGLGGGGLATAVGSYLEEEEHEEEETKLKEFQEAIQQEKLKK